MNKLLFLGGGHYGTMGLDIESMDYHPDYWPFVNQLTTDGWQVTYPSGQRDPESWYDLLMFNNTSDTPVLGHSAGGMLAMWMARDRPKAFNRYLLFNVPLIYPSTEGWQECYKEASLLQSDITLVMSKNDPIMTWVWNGFTMYDAIDAVKSYIKVMVLDTEGYQHSPFKPVDVVTPIFTEAIK